MELKEYFLGQLEREAVASRKVLERVPEGQNSWKPHEKSMELGYLAALVASMPGWPAMMIERDQLDFEDPSAPTLRAQAVETNAELLRLLDDSLEKSRRALENTTEEHLMTVWRLVNGKQVLSQNLRYITIANMALSHMAHHRGQLTVYLRLNDAKVPAIYGPSADERW